MGNWEVEFVELFVLLVLLVWLWGGGIVPLPV